MATLGTLRNSVAAKLGLDNSDDSDEQELIDQWANEGVVEILLRTHCTVERGTMAVTAGTWDYQLDTSILAIRELWREDDAGDLEPVMRVTEQELLDLHRSSTSGDATYLRYAVAGNNLLLLWPTPSTAYSIRLLYVPRPTAMDSADDDPSAEAHGRIPAEFHKAIEYYALWQGAEFDENQGAQGGERQRAIFENYLASVIRPAMRRKGGSDPAVARRRAWRHGRRLAARDNDRY